MVSCAIKKNTQFKLENASFDKSTIGEKHEQLGTNIINFLKRVFDYLSN